jgi:hypothetical protein
MVNRSVFTGLLTGNIRYHMYRSAAAGPSLPSLVGFALEQQLTSLRLVATATEWDINDRSN